jgi:hypothetical protein
MSICSSLPELLAVIFAFRETSGDVGETVKRGHKREGFLNSCDAVPGPRSARRWMHRGMIYRAAVGVGCVLPVALMIIVAEDPRAVMCMRV